MKNSWQALAQHNWDVFKRLNVFIQNGQMNEARDYIKYCEFNEATYHMHTQIEAPSLVIEPAPGEAI